MAARPIGWRSSTAARAPGSVAAVARELSAGLDVLEPLQAARSLDGQIAELRAYLERRARDEFSRILRHELRADGAATATT